MPTTLASTGFSQEAFDSFLASRDEPGWITDLRRDAWARFAALGMPARNDEEWVRTDIRLFKLDRYGFATSASTDGPLPHALLAEGVELAGSTATLDSAAATAQLSEKWANKGVLFGSLPTMLAEHGDLLRPFFERELVN